MSNGSLADGDALKTQLAPDNLSEWEKEPELDEEEKEMAYHWPKVPVPKSLDVWGKIPRFEGTMIKKIEQSFTTYDGERPHVGYYKFDNKNVATFAAGPACPPNCCDCSGKLVAYDMMPHVFLS